MKLALDEHIASAVAGAMARAGVEVLSIRDLTRKGSPDAENMAASAAWGGAILTFDTDYLALAKSGVPHGGVIWCPQRKYAVSGLIRALLALRASGLWPGPGEVHYL